MTGDFIKITNLKVFAHHGVFPEETRDGQDFYVNAKLFLDCRKAGKTDNLSDSLNYGEVSHFITDFLQDHTYKLIESVAEQLAEAMLLSMPVLKGVEIELCKPHAPIGLPFENVSVTMKRQWHEVYLAVGSNLGDKNAYIGNGIDELRRIKEIKEVRVSELLVTKPYGGVEQDDFVNGAIALKTLLSPQELLEKLGLIAGSVTPLGILNDQDKEVKVFFDRELTENEGLIGVHPNENTATVWMKTQDLIEIIREHGNEVVIVDLKQ